MKKRILVLGCTGSIGSQTLDIARKMRAVLKYAEFQLEKMKKKSKNYAANSTAKEQFFQKTELKVLKNS